MAMTREEASRRVLDMAAERACVDRDVVSEESSFGEDLCYDDLDLVELVMEVEEEFGVELCDEAMEAETPRAIVDFLMARC